MVNKQIELMPFTLLWLLIFAPQVATAGWQDEAAEQVPSMAQTRASDMASGISLNLPELIYDSTEHFSEINSANLDGLLKRIGDSTVVLLGESSHGTREFYQMRARITRELIEKKGFNIIAVEADWPDASRIDFYIRGSGREPGHHPFHGPMYKNKPFSVFPEWMWRNHSVLAFTHWLKDYNRSFRSADDAVGFYGLDIYNIFGSIELVLDYLLALDPAMADVVRRSYGCLLPWANDPSDYGRAVKSGRARVCKHEVNAVLQELLNKQKYLKPQNKQRYFAAVQNARLIKNGERYFRTMNDDDTETWNQRDFNMFESLQAILNYRGKTAKAVVWAHNIHIGDSRATDMNARGEINLGQRVRQAFADNAYLIGFGMDHGTVAAAPGWGKPVKVMQLSPSHEGSYEHLFHQVKADNFLLPLRYPVQDIIREKLLAERLERAIGVAYDAENELKKHYYSASLPRQFDEYIWFDETQAVKPLSRERKK